MVDIALCTENLKPFHEQENRLQHFKLPKPGICLGGYLQIELCGRVQRQEMDDLFYIWLVFILLFYHFWGSIIQKEDL